MMWWHTRTAIFESKPIYEVCRDRKNHSYAKVYEFIKCQMHCNDFVSWCCHFWKFNTRFYRKQTHFCTHTPNSVLSKIALKFYQLQAENLCAFRLCLLPNCFLTAHSSREFVFFWINIVRFSKTEQSCVSVYIVTQKTHTIQRTNRWTEYRIVCFSHNSPFTICCRSVCVLV